MKTITLNAHAKINLSLDVIGKLENGYHELSMIMQEIDLKDKVTIKSINDNNSNIKLFCDKRDVPIDERNIAYKAVKLMKDKFSIDNSIVISIEKNIPLSGGLGGGSTDAAATLKGLNKLWNLNLTEGELMELGVKLGADVPFFIKGGTMLAEGIGEKLTPLTQFKDRLILIANPGIFVSTKDVYENLDLKKLTDRPDIRKIIEYIESGDTMSVSRNMKNVLETVTVEKHKVIDELKRDMLEFGAEGSLMSGSGASVFGIFDSELSLDECKKSLEKKTGTVIKTVTI